MKYIALLIFLFSFSQSNAQLKEKMVDNWKLNSTVSTEFTTSDIANQQVTDNGLKYRFLDNSYWSFKKDGKFEVKLVDGKIEKGSYSANENRFIIIFDKEEIEEFNTAIITIKDNAVTLNFGRGMTRLFFQFSKK